MLNRKRIILEIIAFAVLGVAAVAGWVSRPTQLNFPKSTTVAAQVPGNCQGSGTPGSPLASPAQSFSRSGGHYEQATVRRGRSTGKSVAIVAGSAGMGAAVGALAGGGKGAGIGALAGGGAGLIYDQLTHETHSGL